MPAKSKVATVDPAPRSPAPRPPAPRLPARKAKIAVIPPSIPVFSESEIDAKLEQIRIRGAQISADLNALSIKLGLT